MKELLIATGNPGKFKEISAYFDQVDIELISINDLGLSDEGLIENGETFDDNSLIKAKFFAERSGLLTLAEDSGVIVDALKGELGVKTRRWGAGASASDEEWLEYFMNKMEDISNNERTARFECSACLYNPDNGEYVFFEGKTEGTILENVSKPILKGLPLSSCFVPKGFDKTYSQLGTEEKNKVSHRGKAIQKLVDYLES